MFGLLINNDPSFDINQLSGVFDRTDIVFTRNHPLHVYEDLVRVGVATKALDRYESGRTVMHHSFSNMFYAEQPLIPVDVFLDGAGIAALLTQAGADPQATDRGGHRPEEVSYNSCFPEKEVEKRLYTAIWHQALKSCGLSASKYCPCPVHHQEEMFRRDDSNSHIPSRRWGLDRLLPYETFEEEMTAAFRGWDKDGSRRGYPRGARSDMDGEELMSWEEHFDGFDEWIQEVLIQLQFRQKKASSQRHMNASLSDEGSSRSAENQVFRNDETQSSDHSNMKCSPFLAYESTSNEDWETKSSSSSISEENWESAPET